MEYPFDKLFLVCNGPRCNNLERGDERGEPIQKALKSHNKTMGRKPFVRVCATSCFDMCDHGPNMVVEPGHTFYSHLTAAKAIEAYASGDNGYAGATNFLPASSTFLRSFGLHASA